MKILAMDTSNQVLSVALLDDKQLIGEITTNIAKNHSVRLMPAVEKLMKDVNVKPSELDRIIVAQGPGSYTGVRIGLATAKTMAWALDIPVIGVSSLEALAYQGILFDGIICPFFDARRGLVYTGAFQWKNEKLEIVMEEENILMTEWLVKLQKTGERVLFLSQDTEAFKELITEYLQDKAVFADKSFQLPRAAHLALLGEDREAGSVHTLVPNYLRLAEAEANWQKKQKEKADS
ncbi:tRNA (adenosine(37)-N6)-threonylcarbamoyltransferase complex dimerization subunit type 1 TsaB [Oceanobacillus neutriphilus]|uniref:tRNA (Adenosine(37)-N6)-threonylcarbamoyltransferase complex dimerization subunit type 1 TsaB n=1 Tax=Oceanobacillus neutriphilus TaxID=531815 RepID=A0ABQ2P2S4_9BACI|nr:tRNA (adenosine(37)-N6)-threonylcarbamoyltransferase complex dimerization subunit type 1 TsaB [Oceanobacillus neutriphilus]GGP16720.1 tRNA (adenosine(37)-N6)-threonylcarbamoyltransferase complex dimerization subunit type 1 TsaB [Oceanobacillus neutriphilus]